MRALRAARRLWRAISEPRHLKAFYCAVYATTTAIGIITLVSPPTSVEGTIGALLTLFWAGLLTLGGLVGAVCVLPGWWWLEKRAVLLILAGAASYGGIVIYLQAIAPPGSSRFTQLGFIVLAIALFILRLMLTRRWDYEPRRR